MLKMHAARTLGLLLLVSCLYMDNCQAGNVGKQRRVQTSATTTSTAGATARQLADLGLPLFHATYATNDEYIETPFKPRQQQQQQQQARRFPSQVFAEDAAVDLADQLHVAELTPAQLQQLLLINSQATASGQQEGRLFHKPIVVVIPAAPGVNFSSTITNTAPPTTTEAPATDNGNVGNRIIATDFLRTPQLMPIQYFQTRQGQYGVNSGLGLPYGLFDVNNAASNAMPLVPVTLGNNAVGYVPLNLRMFRQLIDGISSPSPSPSTSTSPSASAAAAAAAALPIRENDDDAVTPLEAPANESDNAEADEEAAEKVPSSRFQLFGQGLRQRPVLTFAKNLRRVQHI